MWWFILHKFTVQEFIANCCHKLKVYVHCVNLVYSKLLLSMERRSGQKCYSRKLVRDPRSLHLDPRSSHLDPRSLHPDPR